MYPRIMFRGKFKLVHKVICLNAHCSLKKTSEQTKSLQAKFDIGIQSEFLYIQIYMSIPHEFYKFWCLLLRACQLESVLHLHFLFALLAMNSFQKHGFFHILKNTLALMVVQVF